MRTASVRLADLALMYGDPSAGDVVIPLNQEHLAGLAGTGPNGRIVRRDLERFLAAPAAAAPAAAPAAPVTGLSTAPVTAGPTSAAGRSAAEQALVRDEASFSARPTAG